MKKILAVILSIGLVAAMGVTAVGCGKEDKNEFTVGICQLVQHSALDAATQGFKDAVKAELEKEGKTVKFDEANAQGDSATCATIVNGFVSSKVDLIMANATPALQAAANATLTIPVLGTSITEYGVALGINNFNGTVGGNVSGTSDLAPLDEQAQMMIDLLPNLTKVGIVYCSAEANSQYQADVVKAYFDNNGIACEVYTFSDSNDIAQVVNNAIATCDALYVPTDNTVASNGEIIDNICRPAGVPVYAGEEGICQKCGFATLSISYYNIGYKTGEMAAQILLGKADVATMAIAYDESPVKKYNATICEDLGINVPVNYVAIG